MNKVLIIIPTYDEKENVGTLSKAILDITPDVDLLFVDANSPDGTGRLLDELSAADSRLFVLHQAGKMGLGRAYIEGFQWALKRPYEYIFEMDADLSHNPREIPHFLKAAEQADLILGSRYINGIRITNWPLSRLLLSMGGALYVRIITGMPFKDPTGGFKCFRRKVLESMDLNNIKSNGYSFQIEMTHSAWMKGYRVKEIPITFEDRRAGYSKMSGGIFREALKIVGLLWVRNGLRRSPRNAITPPPSKA
ncbi:MAG: polyprenol monophosphomannose synthase [bacterium]